MTRRPFLRGSLATVFAGGLFAGRSMGAEQVDRLELPSGRNKLGFALVGLGSLSKNQIAPALLKTEHCELKAIVTGTPEKKVEWQKQYGIPDQHCYDYESFDRIAEDPAVDVVYVVLPNSMHHEFTLRAAAAGKHVFCEKPMANTAQECEEMIAACNQAEVRLGVGYRCQFEPYQVAVTELARKKTMGAVRHLDAAFGFQIGDPTQWRLNKKLAGGGALMDVGIYALQACRMLAGEEPVRISAFETKTDPVKFNEVDETIQWMMQFPSGITANCLTTYGYNGMNSVVASADHGRFGINSAFSYSGQTGWTTRGDVKLDFPATDHFQVEMDKFAEAVKAGAAFGPDGHEGLRDLQVIEAIYRSIASGKAEEINIA